MDYNALKNLLSTGMCEHQAYKQKVENNMAALNSTWFQQPCATPLLEWMYILAQPHVFDVLGDIQSMLAQVPTYYPQKDCIFKALTYTIPEDVKCVIICQDPYPRARQAIGLCLASEKILPSLRNFFKIVYASYGFDYMLSSTKPPTGDLEYLAEQGVLLLNSALTVEENSPGSHMDKWKPVIEAILTAVYQANPHCAFLAMGKPAKEALLAVENNLNSHPLNSGGPKPFWYEMHPSAWIRHKHVPAALETFNQVRNYLNGLQPFKWIQNSKGLWQYRVVSEYINWMPNLTSSTLVPNPTSNVLEGTSIYDVGLLGINVVTEPDIPSPTSDIHDPTWLDVPNPAAPIQTICAVTPQPPPPKLYSLNGAPVTHPEEEKSDEEDDSGPN